MKRVVLMISCLLGIRPATVQAPREPESYALSQCAVVRLGASPRLYLTRPSGELEAVDVRTGAVLWHTKQAAIPLMVRGDRLLALLAAVPNKPGWRLGVLDVGSGAMLARLPVWGMGRWQGTVGGGMGSFTTMEAFSADGRDYVVWRSQWSRVGGAARPPEPVQTASGAAEVDLLRATLVPVSQEFPVRALKIIVNPEGGYHTEPFEVAGVTAVAATEHGGGKFKIVLHRKRGEATLPDIVLCEPPGGNSAGVQVSADRRDVLGACQDPATTPRYHYDIVVHSTITGEQVGHVVSDAWAAASVVWGSKLVYYFPDRVWIGDLSTGKVLFEHPLRDLRYHGTYPPSARPPAAPSPDQSR